MLLPKNIKNNYLHIFLFIILLLFILYIYLFYKISENYENNDSDFNNFIHQHIFYNEKNELIDHKKNEIDEQYQSYKFIEPNDIVLELGGRYGTVSCVINKLVNEKEKHVVVEPDENVIPVLEKNKLNNQCNFTILPKFISNKNKKIVYDGYGTRIIDDNNSNKNDKQISYDEFKKYFPQSFNVLVADCEGCLEEFLDIMGGDIHFLKKIIFEEDQPNICNYQKIKEKLVSLGYVEKNKSFNEVFRYVYMKKE